MSLKMPMLVAFAALALGGCNEVQDLFASDFKKFQRCVESTSKDGLVTKVVAKQACATKYATDKSDLKTRFTVARGGFGFCPDGPCDTFNVDGVNPSNKTIIVSIHVTVEAKGKEVHGVSTVPMFVEPGASLSAFVKLNRNLTADERAGHKWYITGVAGIDIDG
jgi:hypothetical protein